MRQPCSRGSPRPRGYIHQSVIHFISLSKRSALQNHSSSMADFIFPEGPTQRDTGNSSALIRTLIVSDISKHHQVYKHYVSAFYSSKNIIHIAVHAIFLKDIFIFILVFISLRYIKLYLHPLRYIRPYI